jgi:hypothetical protein
MKWVYQRASECFLELPRLLGTQSLTVYMTVMVTSTSAGKRCSYLHGGASVGSSTDTTMEALIGLSEWQSPGSRSSLPNVRKSISWVLEILRMRLVRTGWNSDCNRRGVADSPRLAVQSGKKTEKVFVEKFCERSFVGRSNGLRCAHGY